MSLEAPEMPKVTLPVIKKEFLIGVVLIVLAIIPSVYFYTQYQNAQKNLANPTQFQAEEAKKLVDAVGKLMTLPQGETPTVATVNDKEKLKNQAFFANAENGDKVLIYASAKKAILYRPSIHKIIDVAPVNIGAQATESATLAQPTSAVETVKFILRNGTSIVGLTKKFETELKGKVSNAEVTDKDNARRKDYDKSIIIDVKGTKAAEVAQIAKELALTVAPLPSDEATPSGDYLVILGSDKK